MDSTRLKEFGKRIDKVDGTFKRYQEGLKRYAGALKTARDNIEDAHSGLQNLLPTLVKEGRFEILRVSDFQFIQSELWKRLEGKQLQFALSAGALKGFPTERKALQQRFAAMKSSSGTAQLEAGIALVENAGAIAKSLGIKVNVAQLNRNIQAARRGVGLITTFASGNPVAMSSSGAFESMGNRLKPAKTESFIFPHRIALSESAA